MRRGSMKTENSLADFGFSTFSARSDAANCTWRAESATRDLRSLVFRETGRIRLQNRRNSNHRRDTRTEKMSKTRERSENYKILSRIFFYVLFFSFVCVFFFFKLLYEIVTFTRVKFATIRTHCTANYISLSATPKDLVADRERSVYSPYSIISRAMSIVLARVRARRKPPTEHYSPFVNGQSRRPHCGYNPKSARWDSIGIFQSYTANPPVMYKLDIVSRI